MNTAKRQKELPQGFARAFKPADIRGVYPEEINEEVAYRAARAFVALYGLRDVLMGRDMRLSSPSLRRAFVRGVRDEGARVIDIGLSDTPGLYFASATCSLFGAMITASHSPKDHNGIKFVKSGAISLTDSDGLDRMKAMVADNRASRARQTGALVKKSIGRAYKAYLHSLVRIASARPIEVVVDAGNGMATNLAPIFEGLPVRVHPLFFGLDGDFPNRGSDPTVEKNLGPIHAEIRRVKPDFGVAFDGDVDRAAFFDEEGRSVGSAVIGALIAKRILQKKAGAIIYNNFTGRVLEETARAYGGEPVRAPVGHSFMMNAMRKRDALFGCELSGHLYFKEHFYTDSGILAFLRVLEAYADPRSGGKKFSELVAEFNRYRQTEEVLIEVRDKEAVLAAAAAHYKERCPQEMDLYDGLRVVFSDYWFTLGKSVTEDALKLVVEAVDEDTMARREREILSLVRELDQPS